MQLTARGQPAEPVAELMNHASVERALHVRRSLLHAQAQLRTPLPLAKSAMYQGNLSLNDRHRYPRWRPCLLPRPCGCFRLFGPLGAPERQGIRPYGRRRATMPTVLRRCRWPASRVFVLARYPPWADCQLPWMPPSWARPAWRRESAERHPGRMCPSGQGQRLHRQDRGVQRMRMHWYRKRPRWKALWLPGDGPRRAARCRVPSAVANRSCPTRCPQPCLRQNSWQARERRLRHFDQPDPESKPPQRRQRPRHLRSPTELAHPPKLAPAAR